MARSKTGRVTNVPPTAITSGAKLTDFIPLPLPLFIAYRFFAFWLKHWYVGGLIFLYLWVGWEWFLLMMLTVPILFLAFVWGNNKEQSFGTIIRAAVRLGYSRRLWKRTVEAGGLNNGPYKPYLYTLKRPPKIANHRGTSIVFTLSLSRVGKTVSHLENAQEYIVAGLNARRSRVKRLTPGVAELTVEWDPGRSVPWNPIRVPNVDVDPNAVTQLPTVSLDEDVELELDTSLLVVGESGSGKSNLTWNFLNSLNANKVPYRLNVIDPKAVELAELENCPYTKMYVDRARDSSKVIDAFHNQMEDVLSEMKRNGVRKVEIGEQHPLHILIIDELLLLGRTVVGQGQADTKLGEILSIGRAAGFIVIANSQLGQVDVIGRIRDLFPQRICMAVKSADLTNAVLGPHAESRGARCTEITEKGVGYVYTDRMGNFERFRPPLIADVRIVARGGVYTPPTARRGRRGR